MKTFFICAENAIEDHVGETYDDFLEVVNQPTVQVMPEWFNRIRNRVRKLWHNDNSEDRYVEIYLDAMPAFHALLVDLQIVIEKEEGIEMELVYLDPDSE